MFRMLTGSSVACLTILSACSSSHSVLEGGTRQVDMVTGWYGFTSQNTSIFRCPGLDGSSSLNFETYEKGGGVGEPISYFRCTHDAFAVCRYGAKFPLPYLLLLPTTTTTPTYYCYYYFVLIKIWKHQRTACRAFYRTQTLIHGLIRP